MGKKWKVQMTIDANNTACPYRKEIIAEEDEALYQCSLQLEYPPCDEKICPLKQIEDDK